MSLGRFWNIATVIGEIYDIVVEDMIRQSNGLQGLKIMN